VGEALTPRRRAGDPRPERLRLSFQGHPEPDEARRDLSCVVRVGEDLWLGSDEGTTLERLSPVAGYGYGEVTMFDVADFLDLPGDEGDEIDIEGLDFAEGWLWLIGSHSARRGEPGADDDVRKQLRQLERVKRRGNRCLLARVPLRRAENGRWEPVHHDEGADGSLPVAARLAGGAEDNALVRALRKDDHLAPFLGIPGRDNGFDVEGLAIAGERVFVGLRGPVLRGWAVVLSIMPVRDPDDPTILVLARVGGKKRRYAKHFLDLRGLGVRELVVDGDDLLVLAGPTMDLDGRAAVFRWRGGARADGDSIVRRDALEHVLELPYGVGENEDVEHPEGLALMPRLDGGEGLLVVYDSPRDDRLQGADGVEGDLYPLG
jgi:hypothetical protein